MESSNKVFLHPVLLPQVLQELRPIPPKRRVIAEWALPAMTIDAAALQMFSLEVFAKLLERIPGLPALLELFGLARPVIAWAALSDDRGLCWLFAFV